MSIIHDCEAEEFPDSPFAQETYGDLHQTLLRCPMPEKKQVHKADITNYADQNFRHRTLDPNLLVQRYFFDHEGLGEKSKEIKKPHKDPPIYSTIKCAHKGEVRMERAQQTSICGQQQQQQHLGYTFWKPPAGVWVNLQPR